MGFHIDEAIEILQRTPKILEEFISGLTPVWLLVNEGPGTWNVTQVVEHLIEAEKNNWIPRLEHIIQEGDKPFPAFNRFAHMESRINRQVEQSLLEFKTIREKNITRLKQLLAEPRTLEYTGYHPDFGRVRVPELISTWVVHDFTHITQITRVMAKRYDQNVGPWKQYLGVLK